MKLHQIKLCLLLLSLPLLLSACASGGGQDWDEHTLVFADVSGHGVDREAMNRFNREHEDMQIEVRDYSDEDGLDRLRTEIMAGKVPDIIELNALPYRLLIQQGYLENLWPYIESDPELGREAVMEAPLKAAEVDGGLYSVFREVLINTLVGAERVVGDRYGWTTEDLLAAFETMPAGSTITDYYATKSTMFGLLCPMNLDSYVNWETGECSFDAESFRNTLQFVNSFPDEVDHPIDRPDEELRERRQEGLQMLWMIPTYSPDDVQIYDLMFGEKTTFIGYPTGDGSVGSSFFPSNMFAMSSTCRNKEAAWDYLRETLLPNYTRNTMKDAVSLRSVRLPVNRADYDLQVKVLMDTRDNRAIRGLAGLDDDGLPPMTGEEVARFQDFYDHIDKIDRCDQNVYDIVWEQCGAYFAGDKSLDETIELIQRRVKLYVNEMR